MQINYFSRLFGLIISQCGDYRTLGCMIRIAKFPRLRELRERELGWDAIELAMRLNNRPSIASIYRLESGQGLRIGNTRRVFDVINAALGNKLDPATELKFETQDRKKPVPKNVA